MAEILSTIVGLMDAPAKIKQYVIEPLKFQFRYLCCSDSIIESLRAEVRALDNTRDNLQQRVDAARGNLEIIRPHVEEWLKEVEEIKRRTDRIFYIPEVQQGCVNRSCPNLKLRYSVSQKAKKMANSVARKVQDARNFHRVADPASLPRMEIIPVASCPEFESRKTTEEQIMAALRDDRIYLIGICGMGGVGKTTMAKKMWKRSKEENLFEVVAMAVASQQPEPKRIQREIAEALDLELKNETELIRAGYLCTRLMQEKRILIIIDDIWASLNLEELGIPSLGSHKGCKVILTSRDSHVCTVMKATKIFSLDGLREEEAWALFKDNAGTCVDDPGLHEIAKHVAKECDGLPLALVTVGCALRDQNAKPVWENALVQLQRPAPPNIPDVLEDAYPKLMLSYNHLKNDKDRYLFLLCCLFPEDSRISLKDLLYYGVGLGIFSNLRTLREARNSVYAVVGRLKSRYMLMDAAAYECAEMHDVIAYECVKMHDVIRDMAITIACKGEHVFMISHETLEWPEKDSYENYTCISLTLRDDVMLPECINCPTLKMLRINWKKELHWGQLPRAFFDRMRELNVLDSVNIGSLPSSLQSLINVRTLRLRDSYLKTISMIGQIVKLEILDLRYSRFVELPKEIGGLEKLKSLDLRWCSDLKGIAPGVISRLVRLEELFVFYSFENWESEVEGKERRNASLVEVASLKNLTALQLYIPDPKVLSLHWPELERFVIRIGRDLPYDVREKDYGDNNLILDLDETTPLVDAIIRKADRLKLTLRAMGASDELIKSIQERNEHLISLSLYGCNNMKYLVNKLSKENNVFPKLKSLILFYYRDLEGISSVRPLLVGSFDALEVLELSDLCKLTHFWDQKLCLPNLREVNINCCSSLQCVFLQSTAKSADPIEFPHLMELSLYMLPSFISF